MSNNAKKSISATIGTLILMLIINHYFKPNTFDFIIGYMVTNLFIRLIILEQWFQVTLERKQKMFNKKELASMRKKQLDGIIDDLRADNDKLAIEKEHLQEQVRVLQSGLKLYKNHLVEVIKSNTIAELKRNKKEV